MVARRRAREPRRPGPRRRAREMRRGAFLPSRSPEASHHEELVAVELRVGHARCQSRAGTGPLFLVHPARRDGACEMRSRCSAAADSSRPTTPTRGGESVPRSRSRTPRRLPGARRCHGSPGTPGSRTLRMRRAVPGSASTLRSARCVRQAAAVGASRAGPLRPPRCRRRLRTRSGRRSRPRSRDCACPQHALPVGPRRPACVPRGSERR